MLYKYKLYWILPLLLSSFLLSYVTSSMQLASAQQDTTNFLTYTNTDLGFTIKYPSGWTIANVQTDSDIKEIKFSSPDKPFQVLVQVGNAGGQSFNDMSTFFSQHPDGRLLELNSNNYLLSGHTAFRTITIKSLDSTDFKFLAYGTVLADKAYLVTYIAPEQRFPDQLQTGQSIMPRLYD